MTDAIKIVSGDTKGIVERLRTIAEESPHDQVMLKAADLIERQAARVAELEAALANVTTYTEGCRIGDHDFPPGMLSNRGTP